MKFCKLVLLSLLTLSNALKHVLLENHHFINLIGPVTKNSVDAILWEWNDPVVQKNMNETQKTTLYINSPGGSVHAGSNLIQYMRALQAQNITIDCIGENFMSMAFVIFQACDHRMVLENSIGMQHQMSFGLRGNIENMRTSFAMHDRINENIIAMELAKIGIDRETYNAKIAHDWWIIGSDNVEQNTADELVLYSCSPEIYQMTQVRKEKVSHYTFHVFTHKCPLFKDVEVTESNYSMFYDHSSYNQFDYSAFFSSFIV
jgi:ATP-dependent protease ClpP protease subunit